MVTYPNSTETMAELAWRYGEQGIQCWWDGRTYQFPDGSALTRWFLVDILACTRPNRKVLEAARQARTIPQAVPDEVTP